MQRRLAHGHARARAARCARPDGDGVGARVGREHVQRLAAPRCRGRGAGRPCSDARRACSPSARAVAIDDRARARCRARRGARGSRRGGCRPGSTGPASRACAATGEPGAAGELAHLRLVQLAEREAQARERRGRERGEHVALVLALVGGRRSSGSRRPSAARRARSGRWRASRPRAGRPSSSIASRRTLPLQRTHGFGVSPAAWSDEPAVDDAGAELRAQVDREVRHAELVRELARAAHRLRRAAAEIAVVLAGPTTARASPRRPRRPRRATSSAATALSTPPLIATSVRPGAGAERAHARARRRRARGAARRRRARPRGAWRRSARRARCAISRAPMRAASSSGAPRSRLTAALPAASVAPQPLASKPASAMRPSGLRGSSASEMRIRSPQAAPPAAPVNASCGEWPRPSGRSRWVVSCSSSPCGDDAAASGCDAHRASVRAMSCALRRSPVRSRRRPAARSAPSSARAC